MPTVAGASPTDTITSARSGQGPSRCCSRDPAPEKTALSRGHGLDVRCRVRDGQMNGHIR